MQRSGAGPELALKHRVSETITPLFCATATVLLVLNVVIGQGEDEMVSNISVPLWSINWVHQSQTVLDIKRIIVHVMCACPGVYLLIFAVLLGEAKFVLGNY